MYYSCWDSGYLQRSPQALRLIDNTFQPFCVSHIIMALSNSDQIVAFFNSKCRITVRAQVSPAIQDTLVKSILNDSICRTHRRLITPVSPIRQRKWSLAMFCFAAGFPHTFLSIAESDTMIQCPKEGWEDRFWIRTTHENSAWKLLNQLTQLVFFAQCPFAFLIILPAQINNSCLFCLFNCFSLMCYHFTSKQK